MSYQWSNWSGSVSCSPDQIVKPQTEEQLVEVVQLASQRTKRIRVVGSGHSFVPLCESDEILILLDDYRGMLHVDSDSQQATFKAGTKIAEMGEPLWDAGLSMQTMGDIDRQSIAGAISTGTHGTGPTLGSISTQVASLRMVLADGSMVEMDAVADADQFRAAQVSLGSLGILSTVTLQTVPAFRLYEQTWIEPFEVCVTHLDEYIEATRHFEFFWVPEHDVCACKALEPTEMETVPPSTRCKESTGRLARYVNEDRIDASYRILPSERNLRFNEIEFAVPADAGLSCLCEMRALMQDHYPDVVWPIEYRTLAADDIYLSPAYQRPSVTISLHQAADLPHTAFFGDAEAIFRQFDGRPHWGKVHTHTSQEFASLYPDWQRFQQIRRQLDPHGRFFNLYLEELFV